MDYSESIAMKDVIALLFWKSLASQNTTIEETITTFSTIATNYRTATLEANIVHWSLDSVPIYIISNEATANVVSAVLHLARANHRVFYNIYGYNDITNLNHFINLILTTFDTNTLILNSNIILQKELLPW